MEQERSVEGRVRLRQWLELRLDEASIPGVRWLDKEKGIFKMPWKHHSKHSWTEEDALIFKDWAMVTGRYREGVDQPDWPMWKTRVRCAINKAPDIEEVRAKHNLHCEYPFKVYRFVSKQESAWRANASRNASLVFGDLPLPSYMLHHGMGGMHGGDMHNRSLLRSSPYGRSEQQGYPVRVMRREGDELYSTLRYVSAGVGAPMIEGAGAWGTPNVHHGPPPDLMDPDMHQLCLRIQHLHEKVNDFIVTNPNGCCIFFGKHDDVGSPATPEPIMPPILPYVVERNRPYVDQLLANMNRGLILTVSHGNIYAERLCKCAVFVYVPLEGGGHQLLTKLSRRERECIFSYESFCSDLETWRGGIGPRPHFELVLAFGQQLKENVPTDQLLFWCRVALCKAWYKLHRAASPTFMTPLAPPSDHVPLPPPPSAVVVTEEDEGDVGQVDEDDDEAVAAAIATAVGGHDDDEMVVRAGGNLAVGQGQQVAEDAAEETSLLIKSESVIEDGVVQEDPTAYYVQMQPDDSSELHNSISVVQQQQQPRTVSLVRSGMGAARVLQFGNLAGGGIKLGGGAGGMRPRVVRVVRSSPYARLSEGGSFRLSGGRAVNDASVEEVEEVPVGIDADGDAH